MENRHQEQRSDPSEDHTAEEFATANPNTTDPAEPIVPEFTEHEKNRLDTDPNRYANFSDSSDKVEVEAASTDDLSHYSIEDDRIQQPSTAHKVENEADEKKEPTPENDRSQTLADRSDFFEGL